MLDLRLLSALALLWITVCAGCGGTAKSAAAKSEPPAQVAKIAQEDQLNTIQLKDTAAKRLGITIAAIERKKIDRSRVYGGEIALPPGASIIVSAPVGGTLQAPGKAAVSQVGATVARGQPIFLLLPLLSPERSVLTPAERIRFAEAKNSVATARIDADGQVQQALVQVEAARIALERAERLFRDNVGTARAVDDAKAQQQLAAKALEAAHARKKYVDAIELDEAAGQLKPMTIDSPQDGIVRAAHAAVGEVVAMGAPLFEIMQGDPIWVRVPVYAGELSQIAADQPAQVSGLGDAKGAEAMPAQPVNAPPTAVALASAVDLYYALPNPEGTLRPGQRVSVRLPLTGALECLVIPWSAVLHDVYGGTWIYEQTAPLTYVRRRVQVRQVVDAMAILEDGPPAGAKIVTAGVMELFGTEFGFAK